MRGGEPNVRTESMVVRASDLRGESRGAIVTCQAWWHSGGAT